MSGYDYCDVDDNGGSDIDDNDNEDCGDWIDDCLIAKMCRWQWW